MDRNNKIFSPLGVHCHFYANFVDEFSFDLSTNMGVMQTAYNVGGKNKRKFAHIVCIKMEVNPQRRKILLFHTKNIAAMT